MPKAAVHELERRTAKRYRVPGSARVFWDGGGSAVSISDMSSGGCLVSGHRLPEVGTRVFLSLDVAGLPNLRLPASTVRRVHEGREAALRFDVPDCNTAGLDRLLAQYVLDDVPELMVLVIDADERSRQRIVGALRDSGAEVVAVEGALPAMRWSETKQANVVLARADTEGLSALTYLSRERPAAFRIAYGRKTALDQALALGIAQAAADDPCSAKALSELLRKGRSLTSG